LSGIKLGLAVGVDRCPFHLVELTEEFQHLPANLAPMVGSELMELAPARSHCLAHQ
jgi:hypothetical protein